MKRKFLSALAVGVIFIFSGCNDLSTSRFISKMKNKPAPDFELRDLSGQTVRLSELKGKPIVLAFFAYG